MRDYRLTRTGLNLKVTAVGILGFSFVLWFALMKFEDWGALEGTLLVLGTAYPLISLAGELFCCSSPTHRGFVYVSLGLGLAAWGLGVASEEVFLELAIWLVSLIAFLLFLHGLGRALKVPQVTLWAKRTALLLGCTFAATVPTYSHLDFGWRVNLALIGGSCLLAVCTLLAYTRTIILMRNALALNPRLSL